MDAAIKELGGEAAEPARAVPPLNPRSTDLIAFLCDKADRDAAKRGPAQ